MEIEITTLKKNLEQYTNRQVVLNSYEDDEMIERDGFEFQTIVITDEEIQFLSGDKVKGTIHLANFKTFEPSKDFFKNYYELKNGTSKLCIYFP